MQQELRSTFLLDNVAYRHRSSFLLCKQGKRSLQDYVMELHNLEAAMAGAPLAEDVKVTVFMDGVRMGPVSSSPASQKEQVPGTSLLCLSVATARSNLVVVTASVKGYPEPMPVLIDSGATFNFATKASVAKNNALYASALEPSTSHTNVSVRLATGSIVSTRKVTRPLSVKFDDINSVEPLIVLDMDDRYDRIIGMPWLAKHEPWIDCVVAPLSHNPLADRALAGHAPSYSRDGFVHEYRVPRGERQFAGSSGVLELPTASLPRAREPEVGDGENPRDPNTSPVGGHRFAVCNRVAFVQGAVKTQGADAAAARAGRGGTKYCTTWQWPLPKEQVDVIDAFFAVKYAAGMERESKSPHSSPTCCVRKPNEKWRMVHAFNKLNAATIPASTPIQQDAVGMVGDAPGAVQRARRV
ncbi:unnamed protein product [Phytophthora fragariaefolia]|uniref:Unnamed protein product n=1 Tax=Phytophthora fragariaefolia TaxID=1490495 RepID=A0A9W6TS79_9STRA|nr:unnamed protein product [Phytophthora fragariaefolia]